MFLKEKESGHLVEVVDIKELIDPMKPTFTGRYNWGEDVPDPEPFDKSRVVFPSGEPLPRCWTDVHYRDDEVSH